VTPDRTCPTAAGANVGRRRRVEGAEQAAGRFEYALERFNASEAAHLVAGLMRTLGEPSVSVGAAAGSPSEVRITVAWDLSWYQWGVDVDDLSRTVFLLAKGGEIGELDGSARQWNAGVAEGGRLYVGRSGKRPGGEGRRRLRRRKIFR
jgi:hypothetical protein